jgi:glucuronate isomerase
VGCRFTDHALDNGFTYRPDDGKNAQRFADLLAGNPLSQEDKTCLTGKVLSELMSQYASFGFTVQLHIGAQRTTSTRLRTIAGPAGGYAAIGSTVDVLSLTNFLDAVEQSEHGMPRVLLFTLNPADNAVMATLSGSYSKDGYEAFVSQGPAWWWCDHYEGMTDMLNTFVAHSVLSTFIGMTTDSRSVLSFVRHDYFRRILCQWIADKVSCGRMPEDEALLCDLIRRVCYQNAKNRLGE